PPDAMRGSPVSVLRNGPPPPKVVVWPDALFFTRSIPVLPDSSDADERRRQVASQVELALEAAAPFPLNQLYYGHFWTEGAPCALAFAAYRRRFTAEQTAAWEGAEWIAPSFATLVHAAVAPATTVAIAAPEGFTAIHWDDSPVPSGVAYLPVAPEADEAARAAARLALLRRFESRHVVDVAETPAVGAGGGDGQFAGNAAGLFSPLSAEEAASLDVRDKGELAVRRRARRREVLMWRTALGCIAAFGLFVLGELALVGGGLWLHARAVRIRAQAPMVERISGLDDIANRINDLRTKRLLPIEMIRLVGMPPVKPDSIYFVQATASKDKLYSISFRAQTANAAEIPVYRSTLERLPEVAPNGVDIRTDQTREAMAQFQAEITFKPGAVKPAPFPQS
ncbi:MAG: hypothetical protein ACREFX_08150, partial [Opitutaceae bacterium]